MSVEQNGLAFVPALKNGAPLLDDYKRMLARISKEARMSLEYWASFLPDLINALMNTSGGALEVGSGKWSTPIMAAFCEVANREFVSIDEDKTWIEPPTRHVKYDEELPRLAERPWSVVLLDHSPGERRAADVLLFRHCAEYIVVHDYAPEWEAPFRDVIPLWPFHKISNRFSPRTLVLGAREIVR